MDFSIKIKLIKHYLSSPEAQIQTSKDLQDWVAAQGLDPTLAKQMNQQLEDEGIIRRRKISNTVYFQLVDSSQGAESHLELKLRQLKDGLRKAVEAKRKELRKKKS